MRPGDVAPDADARARAGDYRGALALREEAYCALRAAGDTRGAARLAAYQIAFDHLALFGDTAVAHGWLARGIRLVEGTGPSVEAGWVALARALHAQDAAERDHWVAAAERAAQDFHDDDLFFDALAHRGMSLVQGGQRSEGMRRLDEAAAAAHGGDVQSLVVVGEIYCKLMVACEMVLDVARADEWHRVFVALGRRLDLAWASAICRMHVGGVWTAAGRWDEAAHELERSVELYDATYPALRSAACARLAQLRVRQGRLGEAQRLLASSGDDVAAISPAAQVAWQQSVSDAERSATVAALAEDLGRHDGELAVLPGLALLVELRLACGQTDVARQLASRMAELAAQDVGDALEGYAELAAGLVAASGTEPGAVPALLAAARHFAAARLPLEEARARLAVAEAAETAEVPLPDVALSEARRAAEAVASLGAARESDRASAVLRRLGGRPSPTPQAVGLLTTRELEVLSLLAEGLSNPEIAQRLFLARKTVAHHVSNVLAKLGVRNRAAAASWFAVHDRARRDRG